MNTLKINKLLTPYNYTAGNSDRIKYIVIHYVGATGGAKANCSYYAGQYVGASAHYYVDFDGSIWQSVEDRNIAWHCGTKGSYYHPECRNSNSIGIELCVRNRGNKADTSRDWYFEDATVSAAVSLTRELMKKYRIDAEHVLRHYDVTHKLCPNPFVFNHTKHTWDMFKSALEEPLNQVDREMVTYPVKTGLRGLTVSAEGGLNVRDVPPSGSVTETVKHGETVFPDKKTFCGRTVWYHLPDKHGWICADYLDGGWIYESRISSPRKWWYIHKYYTCTKNAVEIIGGAPYLFDAEGYLIENEEAVFAIDSNGEMHLKRLVGLKP